MPYMLHLSVLLHILRTVQSFLVRSVSAVKKYFERTSSVGLADKKAAVPRGVEVIEGKSLAARPPRETMARISNTAAGTDCAFAKPDLNMTSTWA